MLQDFIGFLKGHGVIGLAIAVVIGGKLNSLVDTIVKELLMPFVGILIPGGDWRSLAWQLGPAKFGIGPVLASGVDFVIVAALVFFASKKLNQVKK